jgi:hypothetical protein
MHAHPPGDELCKEHPYVLHKFACKQIKAVRLKHVSKVK